MTGAFCVPDEAPLELATGPRPVAGPWPPRFTKIRLVLDDGGLHVGIVLPSFGGMTHDGVMVPVAFDPDAPARRRDDPTRT